MSNLDFAKMRFIIFLVDKLYIAISLKHAFDKKTYHFLFSLVVIRENQILECAHQYSTVPAGCRPGMNSTFFALHFLSFGKTGRNDKRVILEAIRRYEIRSSSSLR